MNINDHQVKEIFTKIHKQYNIINSDKIANIIILMLMTELKLFQHNLILE